MALFKHLSFIRADKGSVGWMYSMLLVGNKL